MRLANVGGRATLVVTDGGIDVERASGGRFGPSPQELFEQWEEFLDWAGSVAPSGVEPIDHQALRAPVPRPRQLFAVGVNYAAHAREAGYPEGATPIVFTKFVSSLCGPDVTVALPSRSVDWEVELVVAVGRGGYRISAEHAWEHVAGVTVGQDLSERELQLQGSKPQFSLAKSYPQFGPTGPWLVTLDELPDRDDLAIRGVLNGEVVQESRTSLMIDPVPSLIAKISAVCPLLPGDIVFTGTPDGVGNARTPKRFLTDGDELVSEIDGVGRMTTRFTQGQRSVEPPSPVAEESSASATG